MGDQNGHSYTIDAIRVIAILMVVALHVVAPIITFQDYFGSANWWFINILDSISAIAVLLFIMVSGHLMLEDTKELSLKDYFWKRTRRIIIPLILWNVIYEYFFVDKNFTLAKLLTDAINNQTSYHLYFLNIILVLYLLTPLFKKFFTTLSKTFQKTMIFFLFIISFLIYLKVFLLKGDRINGLSLPLNYISYFLAGYYLWKLEISKKLFNIFLIGYLILLFLLPVLNYFLLQNIGWSNNPLYPQSGFDYFSQHFSLNLILMSLFGYVLLRNLPLVFSKLKKTFLQKSFYAIAPLTFGIYLIHPIILNFLDFNFPIWFAIILKIILVFAISAIIVYFVRKIKYLSLIFG